MENTISKNWDFLAPQFVDFSKPVDDSFEEDGGNPEEYFNFDHENNVPLTFDETTATSQSQGLISLTSSESSGELENKNSDDKLSNNSKEADSSDDGLSMSCFKLTKPTINLTSGSESQEEAKTDCKSQTVHSVVPLPPVFNHADIPTPPKTTEEVEKPVEETKPAIGIAPEVEQAQSAVKDERPTSFDGDSLEDEPMETDSPVEPDVPTISLMNTEPKPDAAPTISLPSINLGNVEVCAMPMKKHASPIIGAIAHADLAKEQKPVNLGTNWNLHTDSKTTANTAANQPKKPLQKKRSESQGDNNHRITRSMSRPRRSLRIKPWNSNMNDSTASHYQTPSSKRRRTDMNLSLNTTTTAPAKLTMPQTPTFLKRKMHFTTEKAKNTEELEMERINELQKQMANTRKLAEESYKRLQVSTKYVPVRSQQPTTQPKEFEFRTDTRITSGTTSRKNSESGKDFLSSLRKHTELQKKPKGPTKPQPFHFSTTHQKVNHEQDSKTLIRYKSMAEQVAAFQVKTPERFQSLKRQQQNKGPVQPILPNKLTLPKTPALETRKRKRPSTAVSAKDKEDKEVEDMKNYQFKANPVNPRVMSNINIGVKVPSHKEPTKAIGFSFHTNRRSHEREDDHSKEEEERVEFHARPIPSKILEGVTGLPEPKQIPATFPKSPAFALKNRKRIHEIEPKEEVVSCVKARPAPHVGVPFIPNLERKTTEIKPFSFAQRDEETVLKKEEKKQQIFKEEQKMREFKAQLMPILDTVSGIPSKKTKKTTATKPFTLSHEDIGAKRADDWSKKMAEELEAERQQTFHAKEANVLYRKPFVPQKSAKPLTEINDFSLNSDIRAEQRQQYDTHKKMREHDLILQKSEIEQQNAIREQKEIEQMRLAMVHKANPIRQYKPVEIEPSDCPVTQPKTPKFSDRFKK